MPKTPPHQTFSTPPSPPTHILPGVPARRRALEFPIPYRRALQTNPNDPTTGAAYYHFLYITGRPREGRAEIDHAVALDSADGFARGFNGTAYSFERRYDEAVAEFRKALELGNGMGMNLVDLLYLKGERAEALAALREFYAGDRELLDAVEQGYADGGYPGAMHRAADVWASRPNSVMGSTFLASMWYALTEDRDRALQFLERAYEEHNPNMPYIGVWRTSTWSATTHGPRPSSSNGISRIGKP